MKIDKSKPVLVTGANGYVASWLVKKLLEDGITVHAAVRKIDSEKLCHLNQIAKNSSGKIIFFETDLLIENSYEQAMKDCELIFHTASPFKTNVKNPQKELIDPAVKGTENIFNSINSCNNVKKVVLTSSCAAIYTDASECLTYPNQEINETIWNKTASISHQPYSYSKTLAEKKAWEIANKQTKWQLVVINPSFVVGPFLNPKQASSESFNIIKQMGDGTLRYGVPNIGIGVVDVRDVAQAHYNAGFFESANGRNIVNGHNTSFFEMCKILHKIYGNILPVPNKKSPKWLIWLLGPFINKALTRVYINNNLDFKFKANNEKAKTELKINFRPLDQSLDDSFKNMIKSNIFNLKSTPK
ncbi:MAG: NAD-dependent epimerase/dehydratase family protein [Flavobacteriales bacterium]